MSDSLGQRLRLAREEKGLDLRTIADRTRIPLRTLEALENDDFKEIPSGGYGRGVVRYYAKEVGLDGIEIARFFDRARGSETASPNRPATDSPGSQELGNRRKSALKMAFALIFICAVGGGTVLYILKPSAIGGTDAEVARPLETPDSSTVNPLLETNASLSSESIKLEITATRTITLSVALDDGEDIPTTVSKDSLITRSGSEKMTVGFLGKDWSALGLKIAGVGLRLPSTMTDKLDDKFLILTLRREDLPRIISEGNIDRTMIRAEPVRTAPKEISGTESSTRTSTDDKKSTEESSRKTTPPDGEN